MKRKPRRLKAVIAFRRACQATGTGLSHYILVEAKKNA
ncbi:MAG TPA: modified peptide precursor CbpA [Planctomycetota bacterium]|jgi:modified peptide precursor CbpA